MQTCMKKASNNKTNQENLWNDTLKVKYVAFHYYLKKFVWSHDVIYKKRSLNIEQHFLKNQSPNLRIDIFKLQISVM